MDEADLVYCIRRGAYDALEYGRAYPSRGGDGNHIRVRLPDGRVRKFPAGIFDTKAPPELTRWKLDDQIENSLCDLTEVSFELGGEVRWLTFVTPAFLAQQLPQSGMPCWIQDNMVVVMALSRETICRCLQHLLEEGDLSKQGRLLGDDTDKWFEGEQRDGTIASWEKWIRPG